MIAWVLIPILIAVPKIKVPESSYNFGTIKEGEPAVHIFTILNEGDDTLHINRVRSSCGCTAALLSDKDIPPGDRAEIKVTFDSRGRGGRAFHKTVTVYSDDPKRPVVTLHIKGKVEEVPKPKGIIEPGFLDLGTIQLADTVKKYTYLKSIGKRALTIKEIVSTRGIYVDPWTTDSIIPGDSARIDFKVIPTLSGRFEGVIVVKTNDSLVPQKFIRLVAKVEGEQK